MFGWKHRIFFGPPPAFLPSCIQVEGGGAPALAERALVPLVGLLFTVAFCCGMRLLEQPFWDFAGFYLNGEPLLGTHDAYHWVAGAEGFEFGVGHPMSELLRISAEFLGMAPAQAAFYLPAFFGALTGAAVFLWGWGLGRPCAGIVAGVLSSLSPSFWGRTLLGYYDTDLAVLPFAVLLGLVPALWLHPWLSSPADFLFRPLLRGYEGRGRGWIFQESGSGSIEPGRQNLSAEEIAAAALSWPRLGLLMLAGFLGYHTQSWHSLFPYLTRFSALLIPFLIVVFGPAGGRLVLLRGALCHVLPLLLGLPGVLVAMLFSMLTTPRPFTDGPLWLDGVRRLLLHPRIIPVLWLGVVVLAAADSEVGRAMYDSFMSYAHRTGDSASTGAAGAALIFPSVNLSIIETQLVEFSELILHIYPNRLLAILAMILFVRRLFVTPALWWFVPAAALYLLSVKMGGRMSMFGAPCMLLALFLDVADALRRLAAWCSEHILGGIADVPRSVVGAARAVVCLSVAIVSTLVLVRPLMDIIPAVSQGPILTQSQAQALSRLKDSTPLDSVIWNWWDWGYATHHFSMRRTIADGARHGGPSLFLPAAVYTTADPRFARQLIKYTALKGNEPGEVFRGLDAKGAQDLMRRLGDKDLPLIEVGGTQYLVVSLELLRLGVWVSQYGSWNFETAKSSGSYMNNLDKGIAYNLETGLVQPDGGKGLKAGSIAVFESGGLSVKTYPGRQGGFHFIFNPPRPDEEDGFRRRFAADPLSRFWQEQWARIHLAVESNDKIAMDEVFYNTLMVQLLLCERDDPRFAPYFHLVYDNTYTRVFEVR